jgi:tetratricopeptide (TPR) repeat protein
VLSQLAKLQIRAGMFEAAQHTYRSMLTREEVRFGKQHPSVAAIMLELARALCLAGAHEAATVQGEQALRIFRKTHKRDALPVGWAYSRLASIYARRGYHATPLNYYQRAAQIYEQHLGAAHPDTVHIHHRIHEVEQAAGRSTNVNKQHRRQ